MLLSSSSRSCWSNLKALLLSSPGPFAQQGQLAHWPLPGGTPMLPGPWVPWIGYTRIFLQKTSVCKLVYYSLNDLALVGRGNTILLHLDYLSIYVQLFHSLHSHQILAMHPVPAASSFPRRWSGSPIHKQWRPVLPVWWGTSSYLLGPGPLPLAWPSFFYCTIWLENVFNRLPSQASRMITHLVQDDSVSLLRCQFGVCLTAPWGMGHWTVQNIGRRAPLGCSLEISHPFHNSNFSFSSLPGFFHQHFFLLPGCISCAPHHSPVQINSCNDQRLLPFLLHKFLKCHDHFHSHPRWPLLGALIFVSCSYISSRGF